MDWTRDSDNDRAGKPAATGGIDEAMNWTSDDDLENVNWNSDDDDDDPHPPVPKRRCLSDEASPSRPSMITNFIGMGFAEELVERAIKETNGGDTDAILDRLVTYTAKGKSVSERDEPVIQSSSSSLNLDDDFSDMECFGEEASTSCPSLKDYFINTGYRKELVERVITELAEAHANDILDRLEAYKVIEEDDEFSYMEMPEGEACTSCPSLKDYFINSGYRKELVERVITELGEADADAILYRLESYRVIQEDDEFSDLEIPEGDT